MLGGSIADLKKSHDNLRRKADCLFPFLQERGKSNKEILIILPCEISSSFYFTGVAEALRKASEFEEIKKRSKISLDKVIDRVIKDVGIELNELTSFRRDRKVSYARAVISYLAVNRLPAPGN